MRKEWKFIISNILILYFWLILINKVSYTEELALSLIYVILFIIISENVRGMIKELIISQTLKLIYCYEQLIYLKIKVINKNLKLLKILKQKQYIKNISNIINFKIKLEKNSYLENKKKISNIKKIYYICKFLSYKIYNR